MVGGFLSIDGSNNYFCNYYVYLCGKPSARPPQAPQGPLAAQAAFAPDALGREHDKRPFGLAVWAWIASRCQALKACRSVFRRPSNFSTIGTAQPIIIKDKLPKVWMPFPKKETPDLLHEKITIFIPNPPTGPSAKSIIQQLNILFEVVFQNLFFPRALPFRRSVKGKASQKARERASAKLAHHDARPLAVRSLGLPPVAFMFQKGTYSSECLEIHRKDCC